MIFGPGRQPCREANRGSPAIVVGKPAESPLVEAIQWEALEMPPKENDRLNEQQIEIVRQWIQSGVAWPSEEKTD